MAEICKIISGIFSIGVASGRIPYSTLQIKVNSMIERMSVPHYYSDYKFFVNKYCNRCVLMNHLSQEFADRLKIILTYLIFIPYISLDELMKIMVNEYESTDEYKKEHPNEGNGEADLQGQG